MAISLPNSNTHEQMERLTGDQQVDKAILAIDNAGIARGEPLPNAEELVATLHEYAEQLKQDLPEVTVPIRGKIKALMQSLAA